MYKEPLYYEIAFSFIDVKRQVDLFGKFIRKYSKINVKRFLDIGCGPSLQLREVAKRGYGAIGLDSSSQMLRYLETRAKEESIRVETVKADMTKFELKKKVDFVFIMMGTIGYMKSNEEFLTHLDSVAGSLKKGGLYLIENFRLDWNNRNLFGTQSWKMKRDGIRVKTTFSLKLKDTLTQILKDTIKLEVNDNGRKLVFQESRDTKMIFPQEFLTLINLNNQFEFIGWFAGCFESNYRIKSLTKAHLDNIVILRRR